MSYIWEDELMPIGSPTQWCRIIKLTKSWVSPHGEVDRNYKVSLAWIHKVGKRKWSLSVVDSFGVQYFPTLKAAKAHALAAVILGV